MTHTDRLQGIPRQIRCVDWIVEYYSATEATSLLLNSTRNDAGVGKVAYWGSRVRHFGQDMFYIINADLGSGEILRDPRTGFCIPARMDELGEAICRIKPPIQRKHDYVGDGGAQARKKTLRNVFRKGDECFRLGDALSMDFHGYISFSDRLGHPMEVEKGSACEMTAVETVCLEFCIELLNQRYRTKEYKSPLVCAIENRITLVFSASIFNRYPATYKHTTQRRFPTIRPNGQVIDQSYLIRLSWCNEVPIPCSIYPSMPA